MIALELLGLHLAVDFDSMNIIQYSYMHLHFGLLVCRFVSCVGSRTLRTFDEGAKSEA